jgi:predicted nucleic acid-binding protein
MPGSFIDTNILVYLASGDAKKAERAETLVADGAAVSVQVLNELANVCRRKMHLSWEETRSFLSLLKGLVGVHPLTLETHEQGLTLAERYALSIYDAQIAASALQAECDVLWSEDLQHGMLVDGRLCVLNPFRSA